MITGYATLHGTNQFLDGFSHNETMVRHAPWFSTSALAIGTSLGEMTAECSNLYRDAVIYSINKGINFIDTALNYRGMKSERDIGRALDLLSNQENFIEREAFVISSKAGIIPGDIDAGLRPQRYLEEVLLRKHIVRPEDINQSTDFQHTLAPSYFRFAIEKSREHLGLETIDIYYIHNPECSMQACGPDSFYQQLHSLFECLEEQVDQDTIRFYGMATWRAFQVEPVVDTHIQLSAVIEIARAVAGDNHHFRFIQLPFNASESAANTRKTQFLRKQLVTTLQAAKDLGLFATISAPLKRGGAISENVPASALLYDVVTTEGVFAAMVGMKQEQHINENSGVLTRL